MTVLAAAQFDPHLGDIAHNLNRIITMLHIAAARGLGKVHGIGEIQEKSDLIDVHRVQTVNCIFKLLTLSPNCSACSLSLSAFPQDEANHEIYSLCG